MCKVKKATQEERGISRNIVHCKAPVNECYGKTGDTPTGVMRVGANTGCRKNPAYWSMLVAHAVTKGNVHGLVVGTPPLAATKILLSVAVSTDK